MNNQNKELDKLLVELGKAIDDQDLHGFADYKRRALDWFEAKKGRLYQLICAPDRYPVHRDLLKKGEIDALISLIDVWIAPICNGLPVTTISKILILKGLDKFCNCEN